MTSHVSFTVLLFKYLHDLNFTVLRAGLASRPRPGALYSILYLYIFIWCSDFFPVRIGAVGRWQYRWFNRDYRSRTKCLSYAPHGGSPLHTTAGRCIRAADQIRRRRRSRRRCTHARCHSVLEWLVMREQSSRRPRVHAGITDRRVNDFFSTFDLLFSSFSSNLINWGCSLWRLVCTR